MEFRLLDAHTGLLSDHKVGQAPAYIAASHAWSEQFFPQGLSFIESPGCERIVSAIQQLNLDIQHCWVDTICIDQNNDADKHRQIPLMGRIFGDAEVVLIMLDTPLAMQQNEIDDLTEALAGAIDMHKEEEWLKSGFYWQSGPGRALVVKAMKGIARLTSTAWSTRIWTLQEYILARKVLWIGTDLMPLSIDDLLFAALPDICDTLVIDECIGGEFERIYSFFSGMANCRLKRIDRTRVMELLGNRSATVEGDEVYGVMSAAGVEISSRAGEKREVAWKEWIEAAISEGNLRWLMLPMVSPHIRSAQDVASVDCIVPSFQTRHKASSGSCLDSVDPLGPCHVQDGTAVVTGRVIGTCTITTRLGSVYEPERNRIHRDITLILFAKSKWHRAVRIASAFGAGRYDKRQTQMIAQCLIDNWETASRAIRKHNEHDLRLIYRSPRHGALWAEFMDFQQGQMPGMNEGIAYLATIHRQGAYLDVVVVLAAHQVVPPGVLSVIDLGARTIDHRCVLMLAAQDPSCGANVDQHATLHKIAVTLPITGKYEALLESLPLDTLRIGGTSCRTCEAIASKRDIAGSWTVTREAPNTSQKIAFKKHSFLRHKQKISSTRFLVKLGRPPRPRRFRRHRAKV